MKKWTLKLIQTAWVAEVGIVLIYTMIILPLAAPERTALWLSALPSLLSIIGSQGVAAGVGPLVSDAIKTKKE
jgi:hypothetical protein